jgi:oligoribonuclease (3'-5' exoribonuclease)
VGIQYYGDGDAEIVSNVTFYQDHASMDDVRAALAGLQFFTKDFCKPVKQPKSCKED